MRPLRVSEDVLRMNPGLQEELATVPASKYRNARAEAKGMRFQSGKEAAGVAGLILLEEQHRIFALRLQVRFPLPGGNVYVADAVYADAPVGGQLQVVVKDFKGFETEGFKIKKRLFEETYGIHISVE
jgi:hypothetical protein